MMIDTNPDNIITKKQKPTIECLLPTRFVNTWGFLKSINIRIKKKIPASNDARLKDSIIISSSFFIH